MQSPTAIPLTVKPEAGARLAELGVQAEFEQLIGYIQQNVAGLERLDVSLALPHDTGDESAILIQAVRDSTARGPDDRTWWQLSKWKIETLPPDVWRHFTAFILDGSRHAG